MKNENEVQNDQNQEVKASNADKAVVYSVLGLAALEVVHLTKDKVIPFCKKHAENAKAKIESAKKAKAIDAEATKTTTKSESKNG